MKKLFLFVVLSFTILLPQTKNHKEPKVKLVLQLVVDQLRGDILNKYRDGFSEKGINYLINTGYNFTNAHFRHSITKTAPGHASLATGTIPAFHGIIANNWYDKKLDKFQYACQDDSVQLLGEKGKFGLSPNNMFGSATADEIKLAQFGKAKVFSVSIKDRGAIFLGGHSGKAFWYSKENGNFITSNYYYKELPQYVKDWNAKKLPEEYYKKGWSLLLDKSKYKLGDLDSNGYEKTIDELGYTFPHSFDNLTYEQFVKILAFTPWGDKLTEKFAEEVIKKEKLGQGETTDYLNISFSCTDYIGHLFGPQTLEYEDQIINLDYTISELFNFIDKKIGLDNILVILTADHGVCEAPEYLETQGISTGHLVLLPMVKQMNDYAREKFKFDFDVVKALVPPYFYFNEKEIINSGADLTKVERELSTLLEKTDGVYKVYTATELRENSLPDNEINRKVLNSYLESRSGNLYVVPQQNWFLAYGDEEVGRVSATHGSPWDYDTFVPLILKGPKIPHGFNSAPVSPDDIAPTISDYLKIKSPTGTTGNSLLIEMNK